MWKHNWTIDGKKLSFEYPVVIPVDDQACSDLWCEIQIANLLRDKVCKMLDPMAGVGVFAKLMENCRIVQHLNEEGADGYQSLRKNLPRALVLNTDPDKIPYVGINHYDLVFLNYPNFDIEDLKDPDHMIRRIMTIATKYVVLRHKDPLAGILSNVFDLNPIEVYVSGDFNYLVFKKGDNTDSITVSYPPDNLSVADMFHGGQEGDWVTDAEFREAYHGK